MMGAAVTLRRPLVIGRKTLATLSATVAYNPPWTTPHGVRVRAPARRGGHALIGDAIEHESCPGDLCAGGLWIHAEQFTHLAECTPMPGTARRAARVDPQRECLADDAFSLRVVL